MMSSRQNTQQRISPRARRWLGAVLMALVAILWLVALVQREPGDGLGTDFYPLFRASQALLAGDNPYGANVTADIVAVWHAPYAAAGFAYPLPAVVGVWPLLLLPFGLSLALWVLLGAAGSYASIWLSDKWRGLVLLPLLFEPFGRAVTVKQATMVWFALIVLLLFAMRWHRPWLVGLCIALLPAKPQTALFFALAGAVWAWRNERRALVWAAGWAALIWGGTFALQPTWAADWLGSVARYNSVVYTASLLPLGLLLVAAAWPLPWYARLAALQVVLFPITDTYSALPLLLCWVGVGGPLALVGASLSWLGVLAGLPSSAVVLWATTLAPLMLCAPLHAFERWRAPNLAK